MSKKLFGPRLLSAIERADINDVVKILSNGAIGDAARIRSLVMSEVSASDTTDCVDVPLMVAARLQDPAVIRHLVEAYQTDINHVHEYTVQVHIVHAYSLGHVTVAICRDTEICEKGIAVVQCREEYV